MNSPKEIANNYIAIGKGKVNTPVAKMFVLGILAGIFIAFGGVASTAAAVSIPLASVGKFLGACIFPGGLTMVLLAGSELFTGNCLSGYSALQKRDRSWRNAEELGSCIPWQYGRWNWCCCNLCIQPSVGLFLTTVLLLL